MSYSMKPHGLQPTWLLCPWDFPGKNTGVGCHFPLPGNLPDPRIQPASPESPALQVDSLPLRHPLHIPSFVFLYQFSKRVMLRFSIKFENMDFGVKEIKWRSESIMPHTLSFLTLAKLFSLFKLHFFI